MRSQAGVQVRASKCSNVWRRGGASDLIGRPALRDPTIFDHESCIGQEECVGGIMSDEQPRTPERVELLAEHSSDFGSSRDVERSEGLIEQQRVRRRSERTGDRNLLGLTARELVWLPIGQFRDAEQLDPAGSLSTSLGRATSSAPRTECYVVEHRHVAEQKVFLKDHPDVPVLRRCPPPGSGVFQASLGERDRDLGPGGEFQEPGDGAED